MEKHPEERRVVERSLRAGRRPLASVRIGVFAALASTPACDESTAPLGRGNNTSFLDAASSSPPVGRDGSTDALPFAPVDGPYGPAPDGYAPTAWCAQCACPTGTYCFGGGTGYTSFSGTCVQSDAAVAGIGCQAIPQSCGSAPDCVCLLQALGGLPCYPVCTEVGGFTVYCPTP